jgi:hypothetical protein
VQQQQQQQQRNTANHDLRGRNIIKRKKKKTIDWSRDRTRVFQDRKLTSIGGHSTPRHTETEVDDTFSDLIYSLEVPAVPTSRSQLYH